MARFGSTAGHGVLEKVPDPTYIINYNL